MFEQFKMLLKPQYHALWADYCRYLDLGWQHFAQKDLEASVKYEQLRLLEKAIRRDFALKTNVLARLQKFFVAENLSLYLLLEPLQAWRYLVADSCPNSKNAAMEVLQHAVSPAARLQMVLNGQNPSTYLPMTTFFTAYFLYYGRMQKSSFLKNIKYSEKRWYNMLNGLLQDSFVLLEIVGSKRLKFALAIELNTLKIKLQKLLKHQQSKLDLLDRLKIIVYSIIQFIIVRKRTIVQKGL